MLVSDNTKDASLNYIKNNTTEFHYCSQEPATYAEATITYSLGYKTSPTITGPTGTPRAITIEAFLDGLATGTGVATYWALVSGVELIATNALSASLNVVLGFSMGIDEYDINATAISN